MMRKMWDLWLSMYPEERGVVVIIVLATAYAVFMLA